jgi:hypothetical protein
MEEHEGSPRGGRPMKCVTKYEPRCLSWLHFVVHPRPSSHPPTDASSPGANMDTGATTAKTEKTTAMVAATKTMMQRLITTTNRFDSTRHRKGSTRRQLRNHPRLPPSLNDVHSRTQPLNAAKPGKLNLPSHPDSTTTPSPTSRTQPQHVGPRPDVSSPKLAQQGGSTTVQPVDHSDRVR